MINSGTGSALIVNSAGSSNTGIQIKGTAPAVDTWGIYSGGSAAFGAGHKLALGNLTKGIWSWMQYVPDSSGAGTIEMPSLMVNCWSSSPDVTTTACDTGLSREAAGVVDVGNGTQGDKSGTLSAATVSANVYKGPATAPTGTCSVVGWAFSQDGHISFCNGTTWVTKI